MEAEEKSNAIVPASDSSIIGRRLSREARNFAEASRAPNTIRAYQADIRAFCNYCAEKSVPSLPASPELVADFISWLAVSRKPSTISRYLASISVMHKMAGADSPVSGEIVRLTMAGIRRTLGVAPTQKVPIRIREIRSIVREMGIDLRSMRDRAILLVCYAGALRRSELVSLDASDVVFVAEGVVLKLKHSKTDQDRRGVEIAIMRGSSESTCPVLALENWIASSKIATGPLFRPIIGHDRVSSDRLSAQGVARIIQRLAGAIGMTTQAVGGHSLRSGMITDAFAVGLAQAIIARHSRHRSSAINAYVREDRFKQNPSGMIGL